MAASCVDTVHRLCGRKIWAGISGPEIHSCYPQQRGHELWDISCVEAPARAPSACYDSTVCSSDGGALQRVAEAIDRLEADRVSADATDLAARVAALWSMVIEINPELARLASGYEKPGDEGRNRPDVP